MTLLEATSVVDSKLVFVVVVVNVVVVVVVNVIVVVVVNVVVVALLVVADPIIFGCGQ